jgi:hypothetical protein
MSCVDDAGHFLHSDQLEFSTRHLSSLRSTKINENNNNQNRDPSSHNQHSGHHSSFISKSDYLTEMNLKLLPAISNSIQVNLCQKHLFSHQLTHNMTKDCSLIYQFNTWKLQAQNMGRTCCVHKLIWMSKQKQNLCAQHILPMFWAWNFHVLNM